MIFKHDFFCASELDKTCAYKRVYFLCLICKCTHICAPLYDYVCMSLCKTLSSCGEPRQTEHVVQRAEHHWDTCQSTLSSCLLQWVWACQTSNFPPVFPPLQEIFSQLQAAASLLQTLPPHANLPQSREPKTDCSWWWEMLKTAKLGSVTGNLQRLVLADISDSSLSTQERPSFNQHLPFLLLNDPRDLHLLRAGGTENPSRVTLCGLCMTDTQAVWRKPISSLSRISRNQHKYRH